MSLSVSLPRSGCCSPHEPWNDDANPDSPLTFHFCATRCHVRARNVGLVINLKFLALCRFSLTLPLRDKRLPRVPCRSSRARRGCSRGQGLRCALRGAPRLQEVAALDSSGAAGPRGRRSEPPAAPGPSATGAAASPGRAPLPLGPRPGLVLPALARCACVPPTVCNEVMGRGQSRKRGTRREVYGGPCERGGMLVVARGMS